jgi:hypothetical protein
MAGEKHYPGSEMFWRQAPELIDMQSDLSQLWQRVEDLPRLSEQDVLQQTPGARIGIKRGNPNSENESYRFLELGRQPVEDPKYPNIIISPRAVDPRDEKARPSIMVYLDKWPSGYKIDGNPVTTDFDNVIFVPKREGEFIYLPQEAYGEAVRQLTLKMMAGEARKRAER